MFAFLLHTVLDSVPIAGNPYCFLHDLSPGRPRLRICRRSAEPHRRPLPRKLQKIVDRGEQLRWSSQTYALVLSASNRTLEGKSARRRDKGTLMAHRYLAMYLKGGPGHRTVYRFYQPVTLRTGVGTGATVVANK